MSARRLLQVLTAFFMWILLSAYFLLLLASLLAVASVGLERILELNPKMVLASVMAVVALAGVAPIPWLLTEELDEASPLPRNAYKVDVARALVKRARATIGA